MLVGIDDSKHHAYVAEYRAIRPVFETFSAILDAALTWGVQQANLLAIVQVRTKTIPSYADKVIRHGARYTHPVWQLTDLTGGRVIVEYLDDIVPITAFLQEHFHIDPRHVEDTSGRLGEAEFGYRSIHYLVSLKKSVLDAIIDQVRSTRDSAFDSHLEHLYAWRSAEDAQRDGLPAGPKFRAEIQVRTLLQHAWASLAHDNFYKSEFDVPAPLKRAMNRAAAELEDADEGFARTIRAVRAYRNYFGSFQTREESVQELRRLLAVYEYDPDNFMLARQIARLAIKAEQWIAAEHVLEPFVTRWQESADGAALRSAIQALDRPSHPHHREEAETTLRRLISPAMAAALLDFGLARWKRDCDDARAYFEWAAALDPSSPDALVALGDSHVEDESDHNYPAALDAYGRAYRTAPAEPRALVRFLHCRAVLERSLGFAGLMIPALCAGIDTCIRRADTGVYLPQAYYDIALFEVLMGRPYESLMACAKAIAMTDSPKRRAAASYWMERLHRALDAPPDHLGWLVALLQLASRESTVSRNADGTFTFQQPIIVIAGNCGIEHAQQTERYRFMLEQAFEGFQGTIICGGTTAGISGIVGDLPDNQQRIRKIAYVPEAIPPWTQRHPAYEIMRTSGKTFSATEPLQMWRDLLDSGIPPTAVRLLGVGGGDISAVEYRTALALGAQVGVLTDSGRAAAEILHDTFWAEQPNLLAVPNDREILRAFIHHDGIRAKTLLPEDRDALAREAHETYRREARKTELANNRALADWDDLPESLKFSNYAQVDHIESKLALLGFTLRKCVDREPIIRAFTPAEVEHLAEVEHGRWTVERLRQGWKLGPKDIAGKRSRFLVAWADLPDEIRQYDRNEALELPSKLAAHGYEIIPMPGKKSAN